MKIACFVFVLLTAFISADASDQEFQKLLSLEGTWEGSFNGETIQLTYEPISSRTALMERMTWPSNGSSMTTVYHAQGDRLMATHYCKKNQPRLVSLPSSTAETFQFEFLDGAKTGEEYLAGLQLKVLSANELEQTVRFAGAGKQITVLYKRK